jgi:hypothetical protein
MENKNFVNFNIENISYLYLTPLESLAIIYILQENNMIYYFTFMIIFIYLLNFIYHYKKK